MAETQDSNNSEAVKIVMVELDLGAASQAVLMESGDFLTEGLAMHFGVSQASGTLLIPTAAGLLEAPTEAKAARRPVKAKPPKKGPSVPVDEGGYTMAQSGGLPNAAKARADPPVQSTLGSRMGALENSFSRAEALLKVLKPDLTGRPKKRLAKDKADDPEPPVPEALSLVSVCLQIRNMQTPS